MTAASKPTVLTQYPRAQKWNPVKFLGRPKYSRWSRIADLPFRNPIVFATLYFGGILRHRWTWSDSACPYTNSTPEWLHSSRRIFPTPFLKLPNIALFRYFGLNTTWYLQ